MTPDSGYPWADGEPLSATDLNAAISGSRASISVLDYGAVGDGATDDTASIQAAIATGRNVWLPGSTFPGTLGRYYVSDAINLITPGQHVFGDGPGLTTIFVCDCANLTAAAAPFNIVANFGNTPATYVQQGPWISDMDILFQQLDTASRDDLIHFPPAINITNTLNWRVQRVRLFHGWDGLRAYANTSLGQAQDSVGGGTIDDCRFECLNVNIFVDGAADITHITNVQAGVGGTSNQIAAGFAPGCVGVAIYRADGLTISQYSSFLNQGMILGSSANGQTYGEISASDMEVGGLRVDNGQIALSGVNFITDRAGVHALVLNAGGQVTCSSVNFTANGTSDGPLVVVNPPNGGYSTLALNTCTFLTSALDVTSVAVIPSLTAGTAGIANVTLSDAVFIRNGNTAYTKPTVQCTTTTAILSMANCQATFKGTGAGTFIAISYDNVHRIIGNTSEGWTNSFPVGGVGGVYQWNEGQALSGNIDGATIGSVTPGNGTFTNLVALDYFRVSSNLAGSTPAMQATSYLIGSNYSGGGAEVSFWNLQNNSQAFRWYGFNVNSPNLLMTLDPKGLVLPHLPGTPSYANDAAAAAGGLEVGRFYRNGSVIQVRVS